MLNKREKKYYSMFRAAGEPAHRAKRSAKILNTYEWLEYNGMVRMNYDYEQEDYFSVHGQPETENERRHINNLINKWGLLYVYVEVKCKCCNSWTVSDSIGMVIDPNPLDPTSNPYVIELMASAIEDIRKQKAA